jgi:hypothetical protein
MTDLEFDVLDELYFIQPFEELLKITLFGEEELKVTLTQLLLKNWIKCYFPLEQEIAYDPKLFDVNFKKYYYIATKAGLLAHNGKEE